MKLEIEESPYTKGYWFVESKTCLCAHESNPNRINIFKANYNYPLNDINIDKLKRLVVKL
jgi:hypothetical protein